MQGNLVPITATMDSASLLWQDADCIGAIKRNYGIDLTEDSLSHHGVRLSAEDVNMSPHGHNSMISPFKQEPSTGVESSLLESWKVQRNHRLQENATPFVIDDVMLGSTTNFNNVASIEQSPNQGFTPDPQQHFDQHALKRFSQQFNSHQPRPRSSASMTNATELNAILNIQANNGLQSSSFMASRMSTNSSQVSVSPPGNVGKTPKISAFARRRAQSAVDLRHPDQMTFISSSVPLRHMKPTIPSSRSASAADSGAQPQSSVDVQPVILVGAPLSSILAMDAQISSSTKRLFLTPTAMRTFPILRLSDEELEIYRISPVKPPFTYTELVAKAIITIQEDNPERGAMLKEIYLYIETNFLYFGRSAKIGSQSWRSSVRHNLIFSAAFEKFEGPPGNRYGTARDAKWWRISESHFGPRKPQDTVGQLGVNLSINPQPAHESNHWPSPLQRPQSSTMICAASAPVSPCTPSQHVLQTPTSEEGAAASLVTAHNPFEQQNDFIPFLRPTPFHLPNGRETAVERSASLISDMSANTNLLLSPISDMLEDVYGSTRFDTPFAHLSIAHPPSPNSSLRQGFNSPSMQLSPNRFQLRQKNLVRCTQSVSRSPMSSLLDSENQFQLYSSSMTADMELGALHSSSFVSHSVVMPTWKTQSVENLQTLIALEDLLR